MRQTGGAAVGATSTRSSPFSCASASACAVGMTPSCWPSSSMTRTSRIRIISLTRRSLAMVDPLLQQTSHLTDDGRVAHISAQSAAGCYPIFEHLVNERPMPRNVKPFDPLLPRMDIAPRTLTIAAGDTVTWTNSDGMPHTATSEDDAFDSGNMDEGQSFSFTF